MTKKTTLTELATHLGVAEITVKKWDKRKRLLMLIGLYYYKKGLSENITTI